MWKDEIRSHAAEAAPHEACGYVLKGLKAKRAINVSTQPRESFACSGASFAEATEQGIVYVYHSHVENPATPSGLDLKACNFSQLPYLVYSLSDDRFEACWPEKTWADIIGTPYDLDAGIDCYWLIEEVLSRCMGIDLPSFTREERLEALSESEDWLESRSGGAGFSAVEAPDAPFVVGDIIHFWVGPMYPRNSVHTGVFIGNNTALHFWRGGVVTHMQLNDPYRRRIVARYRHSDAPV